MVKVAQDRVTEEAVAIKIIRKWELTERQYQMVLTEAEVLQRLKGAEHILHFVECFNDANFMCIVTEWLSMDAYDYINIHFDKLMESDIKKLFKMSVLAVQHCHLNRLMHRDIKPENILLSVGEKGEILGLKLADFGMVCQFGDQRIKDEFGTMGY